jgi:hypothetical protein
MRILTTLPKTNLRLITDNELTKTQISKLLKLKIFTKKNINEILNVKWELLCTQKENFKKVNVSISI